MMLYIKTIQIIIYAMQKVVIYYANYYIFSILVFFEWLTIIINQ